MTEESASPRYLDPLLGVVFDLDGTLVNSEHDFGRMRHQTSVIAHKYGVPTNLLLPNQPVARLIQAARQELESTHVPDSTIFRFEAEVHQMIDAIEMEALPRTVGREGAERLLQMLTARGFRLAILTRSCDAFCRGALDQTGLAQFFPYLRSRSSPGPAKPSPEALLLLLGEMGVPRDRALMVGDHALDAECATRARVRFYGILPDHPANDAMTVDRFKAVGASAVATDLTDLGRHLGLPMPEAARSAE